MVKALIDISKKTNKILNIVKAQNGFNDKSQAIDFVVEVYEEDVMEPELKPEFIKKMRMIEKKPTTKIKNVDRFFEKL
jgi:hypothetical protein